MIPDALLAKRPYGDRRVSLEAHLRDTEQAGEAIFRRSSAMLEAYARFFKLVDIDRFLTTLRVACLFHDIGKANADFFAAVSGKRSEPQLIRHEHLSALVMFLPEVASWLRSSPDVDFDVAVAAVLSHHYKADRDGDFRWAQPRRSGAVDAWLDHPEVAHALARIGEIAGLSAPPTLRAARWPEDRDLTSAWSDGTRAARAFEREVAKNAARRALLLATKIGVIASDSVASGLVREGASILDWIEDVVHRAPLASADIATNIVQPRVRQIGARWRGFDELQIAAGSMPSRTLLIAPCGAGKTMAAWKWAEGQLVDHAAASVLFLYPTRGTATEGFRDYVGWAPEDESALVHGTSRYELEGILKNPPESLNGKDPTLADHDARLFALGLWPRRYFSATIDQLLGFLEHQYRSACLVPVLARSLVVVDEVHSFDRKMFDALLDLLRTFDVPVLAMTATLVPSRRSELEAAGLAVFPREEDGPALERLTRLANHPRYEIETAAQERAFHVALERYRGGARVLWVVNTVARCQRLALGLRSVGVDPLVYHSRFRLEDRQRAHKETVAAFQGDAAAFAVTTQVCEMSLDLDADVLVSELAPASSLVQRFGRANRRLDGKPEGFRAQLVVYEPESHVPYEKEDLVNARAFLAELRSPLSQAELASALERTARAETRGTVNATRFLTSGYYAVPGALREEDGFAVPAVLDADAPRLESARRERRPYDGLVLSVPRKAVLPRDGRPSWWPPFLSIAPASSYDAWLGFQMGEA